MWRHNTAMHVCPSQPVVEPVLSSNSAEIAALACQYLWHDFPTTREVSVSSGSDGGHWSGCPGGVVQEGGGGVQGCPYHQYVLQLEGWSRFLCPDSQAQTWPHRLGAGGPQQCSEVSSTIYYALLLLCRAHCSVCLLQYVQKEAVTAVEWQGQCTSHSCRILARNKKQINNSRNCSLAFSLAHHHLGIPPLLDVEDVVKHASPDERSIITYLSQFYHKLEHNSSGKGKMYS